MRLVVLLAASVSVALAFSLHVAWWRWRRPKADIGAILALFLVAPAVVYAALAAWPALTVPEWVAAYVLHAAVSSAYVQTYPATQARSPTLSILVAVGRAPEGLDRDEITAALSRSGLVGERVEDLQRNALVRLEGERLVLTPPGKVLARAFGAYRGWLGLPDLGG